MHSSYSKHWTDALKSRLEITAAPAQPTEYINKTVHKPIRELENDAEDEDWDDRTCEGRVTAYDSARKRWQVQFSRTNAADPLGTPPIIQWIKAAELRRIGPQNMCTSGNSKTPSQERIARYMAFASPVAGDWLAQTAKAPANLQRWLIRKRLECNATWVRATPGSCTCGEETTDAAHELLHCELLEEIRQPFLQALANFRQKALLTGKRLTDEEAAQWITTGDPRIPYTPGLPESGAALRAAALALSAKAIAIQAQRLKELHAATQIT